MAATERYHANWDGNQGASSRTLVNTAVSRYGLAALVSEACTIYGLNNQGKPGADWCVPKGDWQARLDESFR